MRRRTFLQTSALPALSRVWQGFSKAPAPRGSDRVLYCHDSGVIRYNTWDPFDASQLRQAVDDLADNGVDIYAQLIFSQGRVRFFRPRTAGVEELKAMSTNSAGEGSFHRFEPLYAQGIQPIELLIDQAHQRGLKFLAKFRMSDVHSQTGYGFVAANPALQIPGMPGRLDYSHPEVRRYHLEVVREVASRFDVDGFELNFIRSHHCFPPDKAESLHPMMTGFLQEVRQALQSDGSRRLLLGVRVPQTLEECRRLGYEVAAWIKDDLIDYIAPSDSSNSDFNAPYENFAALTRPSACKLYPTLHPPTMIGTNKLMRPENYRALVRTFYAAGADGISVFNFMYHWARRSGIPRYAGDCSGYPISLSVLRELRDPATLAALPRHYLFYPLWADSRFKGRSPSGGVKNDRLVLTHHRAGSKGQYLFRLYESEGDARVTLFLSAVALRPEDRVSLRLNGRPMADGALHRVWNEHGRWDWGVEWSDQRPEVSGDLRRWSYERSLPPFTALWVNVPAGHLISGVNRLEIELTESGPKSSGEVVVDEVEVTVVPKMKPA